MINISEASLKTKDIEKFRKDVLYLLNLTHLIDSMYGRSERDTYTYIKRLRRVIDTFNEKYPNIHLALRKTYLNIHLKFFVRKKEINETFEDFETDLSKRVFNYASENLNTYSNTVTNTLALRKSRHRNMVELIYREDTLHNPNSPEFRLLATHALKNYDGTVNIREEIDDAFCFDFNPDDHQDGGFIYLPRTHFGEVGY